MKKLEEQLLTWRNKISCAGEPLLRASEVVMCFDVKLKTLYTMAYRRKMPSYKVGGRRQFRFSELEPILKRRCR